jgi:acyl carrier protein
VNEADALPKIRQIVAKHARGKGFQDDTPLVSGGLLDSLVLVDMILDLETAFGVSIPTSEVEPDDFDSVQKIRATLGRFG